MLSAHSIYSWVHGFAGVIPRALFVAAFVAGAFVLWLLVRKCLLLWRLMRQEVAYIEMIPPAGDDKAVDAMAQLFSSLHGLEAGRTIRDRLLGRRVVMTFELVATKQGGIRYLARVPAAEAAMVERTIHSYMPEVRCRRVDDYINGASKRSRVIEIKQTGHFAYPLKFQAGTEGYDSVTYLGGAVSKLKDGELMAVQLVSVPVQVPAARLLARRLMHNEALLYSLGSKQGSLGGGVLRFFNSILFGALDMVGTTVHGGPSAARSPIDTLASHRQQVTMKVKPARTLGAIEQQFAQDVHEKLSQPLYQLQVRALVSVQEPVSRRQRVKGVRDWLALFSVPGYQALKVSIDYPWLRQYRQWLFRLRLVPLFSSGGNVLSSSELADLYHFPRTQGLVPENLVQSLSKTLPAPLSLKNNPKFDVVIGRNKHHGTSTDIGLTAAERERHVYVIGGTGNGKTTMLEYGIVQDIQAGKGVAVVDPHGDLAEKLLRYIPEDRIKDVIYFNPSDLAYPIGLNLLELPEGLEGDELLDAKDFITESIISIMRKTFSKDDTGGHRIEYILRNTVQTALTIEGATLFTVFDLLTDGKYLKRVIKTLEDQKLKNFWKNEFGKAGDFQQVKMAAGVTAKIGRFQFSASAERIMSQPKSTINFDEILDGKILICNFAKGLIGEDTSELFGISILAKLQLAAYRRVKQKQAERRPFYIYVDEFQNFATMSFIQLLSEARKYKVFMTMAEQSTSQQDDQQMVQTILANVGTVVCFRSGSPADEELMLPLFRPYVQEGEIANLPTYSFYARLAGVLSQEPVSGETVVVGEPVSETVARQVVETSREQYAKKYEDKTVKPKASSLKSNEHSSGMQREIGVTGARPGD